MATTGRGITYPTTANNITPLATHFANLATSADTAIGVVADASGRLIGTDAQRLALTGTVKREGLLWYSTDTNREWEYDGTVWYSSDAGGYLCWPSSVVGGTVDINGYINGNGSANTISVNGVFSTRFRKYRVELFTRTATAAGPSVRLRASGTDYTTAGYSFVTLETNGTTVATSAFSSQNYWPMPNVNSQNIWGFLEFTNPGHAIANYKKTYSASLDGGSGGTAAFSVRRSGDITAVDTSAFDGFSIINTVAFDASTFLKVIGVA